MGVKIPYAGKDVSEKAKLVEPMPNAKVSRLDLRLTAEDKAILDRLAKKQYRTVSSLIQEWIDGLREKEKRGE
jgi:hypothetical protein